PPDAASLGFEDRVLRQAMEPGFVGVLLPETADTGSFEPPTHLALVRHMPDPPAYKAKRKTHLPERSRETNLTPEEKAYREFFANVTSMLGVSSDVRLYPLRDERMGGYVMVAVIDRPHLPDAVPEQRPGPIL
ncbi:MAG: hypothetical protein V1745_02805, partial [Patescibacteria group bacterium]